MKSRNKIITFIILTWGFLVAIILLVSGSIFIAGFAKLETNLANEGAARVSHVSLSSLNYIYTSNLDNAYWDKAYEYLQNPTPKFIEENFADFYTDYKTNYLIFINKKNNQIVYANKFDLKTKKNVPIEPDILNFFKEHGMDILDNKDKYFQISPRPYGVIGLFKTSDSNIHYFALNYVKDTNDSKPELGVMIYGKQLTDEYLKQLSADLGDPIQLIPTEKLLQMPHGKRIMELLNKQAVYSEPLNKDSFASYQLVNDFNNKPIAILRVEQSREIYNEGKDSTLKSQIILLVFSLIGAFGMSALVYWFFRKQDLITRSFERFVPHELIDLLKKKDILEVNLGDNSKRILSVLFLDIRNFTTISEGMSSQANFDFINTLLRKFAPVISDNNGFIDKYIGDAVMALFPKEETSADDAVKAAKEILAALEKLNQEGILKTPTPVKIGIGINTGEAMLGILGAKGRLEGTVISDMVNTASRIQTLTKTYGHELLISEYCYKSMKHPEIYKIEHVDDVLVKGKTVAVSIYAVS